MNGCEGCPLKGRTVVPGFGPKGGLLVLGEAPGYNEATKGKPFVGEAGRLLRTTLQSAGVNPEDVYYTNTVLCHPPENETPSPEAWAACRPRLFQEIRDVNPTKILALGGVALSTLLQSSSLVSITKARGIGLKVDLSLPNGPEQIYYCLPTLHTASVLRTNDFFRDFADDVEKWLSHDDVIPWPKLYSLIPRDREEALIFLSYLQDASFLSCDLETTGLDAQYHSIESIGFGALSKDPDFDAVTIIFPIDVANEIKSELLTFFEAWPNQMAFHNIGFDLQFLSEWFGYDIRPVKPVDTMSLNYARDERGEGKFRVHGLKYLSKRYDIPDYHFDFDWFYSLPKEERPYDKLFEYQAIDLYVTAKLLVDLQTELWEEDPDLLTLAIGHLTAASIAYGEIERHGTLIDVEHFSKLRNQLQIELDVLLVSLQTEASKYNLYIPGIPFDVDNLADINKLLDRNVLIRETVLNEYLAYRQAKLDYSMGVYKTTSMMTRRKNILLKRAINCGLYRDGIDFNPNSSTQAPKFLEALGLHSESTEREYLWLAMANQGWKKGQVRRKPVDELIEYRQKSKIKSTFVDGLLNVRDKNNRVHPGYIVAGSGTGRPACEDPNLQNIPQVMGPVIRRGFIASPGFVFVSADYSQLELRVVMHLAHDERGIQAFIDGRDIHREVASVMFGKAPEDITFFERYLAKYVDFGLIYGRTAKGLIEGWEMEYLVEQGGERWTLEEADEFIETFLNQFLGVKQYIEDQHRAVVRDQFIKTLMGRRRRFPLITPRTLSYIERQSVNSPIQSLASDINMSALIRLNNEILPGDGHVLFSVYDSIDFEIPEKHLGKSLTIIRREMEDTPIKLDVPIKVDIEIGPNWGDLEKAPEELYA